MGEKRFYCSRYSSCRRAARKYTEANGRSLEATAIFDADASMRQQTTR